MTPPAESAHFYGHYSCPEGSFHPNLSRECTPQSCGVTVLKLPRPQPFAPGQPGLTAPPQGHTPETHSSSASRTSVLARAGAPALPLPPWPCTPRSTAGRPSGPLGPQAGSLPTRLLGLPGAQVDAPVLAQPPEPGGQQVGKAVGAWGGALGAQVAGVPDRSGSETLDAPPSGPRVPPSGLPFPPSSHAPPFLSSNCPVPVHVRFLYANGWSSIFPSVTP